MCRRHRRFLPLPSAKLYLMHIRLVSSGRRAMGMAGDDGMMRDTYIK